MQTEGYVQTEDHVQHAQTEGRVQKKHYHHRHGVLDNGSFLLEPQVVTLAEILKEQEFKTGAEGYCS